jgi:hypothetical protein
MQKDCAEEPRNTRKGTYESSALAQGRCRGATKHTKTKLSTDIETRLPRPLYEPVCSVVYKCFRMLKSSKIVQSPVCVFQAMAAFHISFWNKQIGSDIRAFRRSKGLIGHPPECPMTDSHRCSLTSGEPVPGHRHGIVTTSMIVAIGSLGSGGRCFLFPWRQEARGWADEEVLMSRGSVLPGFVARASDCARALTPALPAGEGASMVSECTAGGIPGPLARESPAS